MSASRNMMFYEPPMMSPEHNSMPTMNTAEMFDNMWCSSDSGVSGDQSPNQPTTPVLDYNHYLWDPGDTSILEANLFNENRNLSFEDDLDLFSFANELGTEDESEQLSFPDNISENSSSSSTITSHSIPSSPEHSCDDMNPSTNAEDLKYPSIHKCEKINTFAALCDNFSRRQKGNYKKSRKIIQDRQRKQASEKSIDNEGKEGCPDQKSNTLKGLTTLSPARKNISLILDSNIKWSELDSNDQQCLADGFDTIISDSLGVREQLDVKAILKPHSNDSDRQDVHINNFTLLDDGKLEAVRRYLKSLEGCHSDTKPYYPRQRSSMEKNPPKKNKVDNKFVMNHPDNLFKKEFIKSKSNNNESGKSRESFSENISKLEKSTNYKYISSSPKIKKGTPTKNNAQAIDCKSSNIDVNMTICQPSISWKQRQIPKKSKRSNTEVCKSKETCTEDQRLQRKYAEYQKQRISSTLCSSKSKEIHTRKPLKDYKKKFDSKSKTLTKKSRHSKQEQRSEYVLLQTRSRKEYRQLMKEKRSGLFLQEQVVSLSTAVANLDGVVHLNPNNQDTDEDVDIMG